MLAQCVPELMIDQIASVAGQVGSIRVGAEQPAFGIQYDSIAVLTRHFPTGHVWRAQPVGRRRRHDVRVQGGRPPNRCQIETLVTSAAPAARIIQHSLDQQRGLSASIDNPSSTRTSYRLKAPDEDVDLTDFLAA